MGGVDLNIKLFKFLEYSVLRREGRREGTSKGENEQTLK